MIKKGLNNIKNHKESFITNVVSMTAVFVLINLLIFAFMNIKTYVQSMENENKGIIYLNTLSEEEINNLQKSLLQENGIISLKFESKDIALQAVASELGINLNKDENPLSDAIFVYIDNDVDLTQLKNKLESYKEISEVDLRSEAINHNRLINNEINRFATFATVGVLVFTLIILYHVSTFTVKSNEKEILNDANNNMRLVFTKTSFFIENIFTFILSYILGFFVYIQIKKFILTMLTEIQPKFFFKTGFSEELAISAMILILIVFVSAFVNYVSLHRYFNKTFNKIKEES